MILHLVAEAAWRQLAPGQPWAPESLRREGFIHCTAGDERLLEVANHLYRNQPGDFLVLDIDETKVTAEVKWETATPPASGAGAPPEAAAEFGLPDAAGAGPAQPSVTFPHIYGPLNRDAIVRVRRAVRNADGVFIGIEPVSDTPAGLTLKTPSQLADELVDATGAFSEALARFRDRVEARMDEMDKEISSRLGDSRAAGPD